jgi:diguanylate cyclase (GGDEF)-like protein
MVQRLRAWLRRHPPSLAWWLLAPAMLALFGVLFALSWTAWQGARQAIERFELQLAGEIATGLEDQLRAGSGEVIQVLAATRDALQRGLLSAQQPDALLQYSANQLRHHKALSFLAISLNDGRMLGSLRRVDDDSLRGLRVGPETAGRLHALHLSALDDLPAGLDEIGPPFDARERDSYRRALRTLRTGWNPITAYQAFGSLGLGASTPVMDASGDGLIGVVAVGTTLTRMSQFLARRFEGVGGLAFIAEPDGQLLATSLPEALAVPDNNGQLRLRRFADMQDPRLRAMAKQFSAAAGTQQRIIEIEGLRYALDLRRVQLPAGLEHVVGVLIEERELRGPVAEMARKAALAVALIAALGGGLLLLALRYVHGRVQAVSDAAQRLADGDRQARAPQDVPVAELQQLGASFNRMSCQVEAAISGLEAEVAARTAQLEAANDELQRLVALDGLTQIANRRHFDAQLQLAWRRCQREQRPLALLLLDVDDFKAYNDHYGHPAGDEVLRQVARVLAGAQRRPDDLAARYGGEEFVLLLPGADEPAALQAGEQLLEQLRRLALPHEKARAADIVTASIGVAVSLPVPAGDPLELLADADVALYAAKAAGRNRVATLPISHDEK